MTCLVLKLCLKFDDAAVDLRTEASDQLCQIKSHHSFEAGKFLLQVRGVLKPADAFLQCRSVDMCNASEVVGAAQESLKTTREDECLGALPAGEHSQPPKSRRTNRCCTRNVQMKQTCPLCVNKYSSTWKLLLSRTNCV